MGVESKIRYVGANQHNVGATRKASDIRYLVYHYTGNDGDSDENNVKYYRDTVVKASAHYFVDDDSITQSVPDLRVAWAIGGNKYASCADTGGGKMHGIVRNHNSISIEMCDTQRDGTYNVTEATLENAVALGRFLMERYHIPIENVYRHFDVTGKLCPRYFVDSNKWAAFKARLAQAEEKSMIEKRYNTLAEITAELPWASPTIQKMIDRDILRGDDSGLDLSMDMIRMFVFNDRAGLYK